MLTKSKAQIPGFKMAVLLLLNYGFDIVPSKLFKCRDVVERHLEIGF